MKSRATSEHYRPRFSSRLVLRLLAAFIICVAGPICAAQNATSDRAAEWRGWALPTAEFSRLRDEESGVVARVPSAWKSETIARQGNEHGYRFIGPNATVLQISFGKIPSGLPLQSYTASILQQLRDLPGSGDSLTVRQVEMSGLDAREIMFALPDENGIQTRRLIWCTVDGPTAVAVVFIEPESHIAEIEPYLRAVVQSITVTDQERESGFEEKRTAAVNASKPARVDILQTLVEKIDGLDASERARSVDRLAEMFAITPDVCVDLILDRRPIVRAATVEAIAKSKNRALDPILRKGFHDQEPFVAERAARVLAGLPNAVALLREETFNWVSTQLLARVWPFLDKKTQIQILTEGFARPAETAITTTRRGTAKPPVNINYTDPNAQLGLLTLMVDIPAPDFKLPLATILKAQNTTLAAAALQVALTRGEALPFDELFKLLSSEANVRLLAAKNLGESATMANIRQLEELAKVVSGKNPGTVLAPGTDKSKSVDSNQFATELQLTIKKIHLRNDLSTATPDQRTKLIADAAKDPALAEWVWLKYVNPPAATSDSRKIPSTVTLSPFGENVFPQQMTHYVTLPNPAVMVDKLGASLNNIQMDSARAQANMVLLVTNLTRALGQQLGAPVDGPVLDYTGIKANAPISFGSWIAPGAPLGINAAQRRAVVLHVGDRDRFERSLAFFQEKVGGLSSFPTGAAVGARFFALLPAVFPLSANMMFQDTPPVQNESILKFNFLGQSEVDGYPVKRLAGDNISNKGAITNGDVYLAYIGDAAVVTPDLASMHDVLQRIAGGGATLAQNQQFNAARETGGEAFYFSDLTELFSQPGANGDLHAHEFGGLQISNQTWDSSYHLVFDDSSWSKQLMSFSPNELSAPRDLLPRSTVLYSFVKFNGSELMKSWQKVATPLEMKNLADAWAMDFEKEVIPEFDSECGAAFLDIPDFSRGNWDGHWVVFAKLKSDRLQRALVEGRLLKNASVEKGTATIKLDSSTAFVAVKKGFLVISDNQESLALLDRPEKLAASSDFQKGVARTPANVVGFGGYNLEATNNLTGGATDSVKAQGAEMILSIARAFHSPSIYATLSGNNVEAHSSISLDREGRYSVAELQALAAKAEPTFAILRPSGIIIADQSRLNSLRLRIKSKAAGEIERIAEDLSSKSQTVEKRSEQDLQLQILPRRAEPRQRLQLPINAAGVAEFLTPSKEIPADDKSVANQAREIAGKDSDAWSVARKLADWTFKNLTWKRVDNADAAQTLATREADCYEFSKLYVAMARSLGLPARVVSGMAYSDGSFGGHAWVEVYVGDWIEIDPTWGTSYVDATHIKDSNGALLTYAALNLVQLEVIETPHTVAEYQTNPETLIKQICKELSEGSAEAFRAASDLSAVTDELMGAGAWTAMTDKERDQLSGAYARVLQTLTRRLIDERSFRSGPRLLKIKMNGDRAEARIMSTAALENDYVKLTLVKRGTGWMIAEITELDSGLKTMAENLQPALSEIRARRSGEKTAPVPLTEFARVILAMQRNSKDALTLVDKFLKDNPKSQGLRYLRSLCLAASEREEEAAKIWTELVGEESPVVPALRKLGEYYGGLKDETDKKRAVEFFKRYLTFEPDDPRAHSGLAVSYQATGDDAAAEQEFRAAIECDQTDSEVYLDLAQFYAEHKRFLEIALVLRDAEQRAIEKDDLFADLLSRYLLSDNIEVPEALAASQPQRMAQSFAANLSLARIRIDNDRNREALPLLRKAASLNSKSSDPYDSMAEAYRKLHEWPAALNAADTAIRLNKEDAEAYFHRACVLARLGRRTEAMTALKRAIELDEAYTDLLADEADLKSLAILPEFKKLLPKKEQPLPKPEP